MLNWIVSSSLRMRVLVLTLGLAVLIGGLWRLRSLPIDIVPEFSPVSLEVQTEALGLSTSEVESLITVPLEADLLNGVPWLRSIESESMTGLSAIEMFFAPGTDLMHARQMVQERLTQAHALPNVSSPPVLLQPVSSASRIMNIGLSSETLSLIDMSVLARWVIVPRLVGVPGVANISVWGHRDRLVQVQVDPVRLNQSGVTLEQVVKTAGESVWASPLTYLNSSTPGAGGFIDTPNQRLGVRHISPTSSPETFAKVPVHGTSLPLDSVADVVEASQPLIGDALIHGASGLMLVVEKFPGANTTRVTEGIEEALRELAPGMKGIEVDTQIYRPAGFIQSAVDNLATGVVAACALALIALGVMLGSWRAALVAAVVIPLSLLAAGWVLTLRGENIDMIMIAGLMLALAVIVDDAVCDMDRVVRRLREARTRGESGPAIPIIAGALIEVRGPLMYATTIIVVSTAPILFMQGPSAPFFQPLFWSYIVAVLVSLAVALTMTPTLALLLLANAPLPDPGTVGGVQRLRRLVRWPIDVAARSPRPAFVLVGIGLVVGALTWIETDHVFVPSFKETDVVVEWRAAPGASLDATRRTTAAVMKDLRAIKGVRNVAAHVGRAVFSKDVNDVNSAEIWVSIDPKADYEDTLESMRAMVGDYPGVDAEVHTFLSKQMRDTLTGGNEGLSVRLYGHDETIIREKAGEIGDLLAKVDGVENVRIEASERKTTLEVKVDLDRARQYGLKPGDVRRAASTLVSGIKVGSLFEQQKVFDVVVRGVPDVRSDISAIQNLMIDMPTGGQVRLADVADVRTVSAHDVIRRQGVSRRLDVDADVATGDIGEVSREVARRIKDVSFPFEYHAQVVGEHFERQAALSALTNYFAAAALICFLVLQAALGSWRLALVGMLGLPVALLGGWVAVLLSGAVLSLGSMLGLVAVAALAVRMGIVLTRRFQALEQQGEDLRPELVQRGLAERFPAIATTLVTVAAVMLPFVVLGDVAGLEIAHATAVVMLGGVVSVALLLLTCVPALYLRFGAKFEPNPLGFEPESA